MTELLLETKFIIPPTRPALVARPHLLEQLNNGLHHKLTLISAPAGFGKTTLVTEWLEHLAGGTGKENRNKNRIAWLSLDEGDNNLGRFLTYFTTALNRIKGSNTNIGERVLTMIQSPIPPAEIILTSLINGIATIPDRVVLVLDDYHRIEARPVHKALEFLLDNLPPQMHMVIVTRVDPLLPLSSLRVHDQLTELRAADLRFTGSEAADFLNCVMDLNLSAENISALESRTEGWIAGLQLAAISLQGEEIPENFIKSFTGSHHFVLDYLIEEVLERQSKSIQTFFLQTSILDQLSGSLCDALIGQTNGQVTLEMLEHGNLFIISLDKERRWYRYHHLFTDLLRQRLHQYYPELIPILYSRASDWFERNEFADKAIEYSLRGGDFVRAAGQMELAYQTISAGFRTSTWLGWAKKLPDELIRDRPVLCTQYAGALLEGGDLEAAESRFQDAERWLVPEEDTSQRSDNSVIRMVVLDEGQFRTLPASIAIGRAQIALAAGNAADAVASAELTLKLSSKDSAHYSQAAVILGLTYWANGELEAAYGAIADWVSSMEKAGNIYFAVAGSFGLADIRIAQGRLLEAETAYRHSLQLASVQDESIKWITAHHHLGLAMLCHEKCDQNAFEKHLHTSRDLGSKTTLVDWSYRWHLAQVRLKVSEGDWTAALYQLEEARRLYVRNLVPDIQPIQALKAGIYIRLGRLAEARNWVRERGISFDDSLSYLSEFEHITLARLSIAGYRKNPVEGDLVQAIGLLERLLKAAEDRTLLGSVIGIRIVLALAYEVQGDIPSALMHLKRALMLAEPEGYIRIFIDEGPPMARLLYEAFYQDIVPEYVRRLLAVLPSFESKKSDSAQIKMKESEGIEPVSVREKEVLQLISEGYSNQEIADRLYLSLYTVKGHARNIYGKLGVKNRTQAVAKGKFLGIIQSD